jgi:hypothetical protein
MTAGKNDGRFSIMSRNLFAALAAAGTLVLIVTLWVLGDPVSVEQKLLSTVLILISVTPLIVYYLERNHSLVPLMALNCLSYIVMFGINGFYYLITENALFMNLYEGSWVTGLLLGIVGLVCQLFGYYSVRVIMGRPRPIRLIAGIKPPSLVFMAWVMLGLRILGYLVPAIFDVPTIGQFVKYTPYVGFGLLIMLSLQGYLTKPHTFFVYGIAFPVEMILRLNTGAIYEPVLLVIFVFLVRWVVSRRINWGLLVAGLLVYATFNPVKHEFRNVVWRTTSGQEKSTIDKISLLFELAGDYWMSEQTRKESIRSNLMLRLNHLSIAALVTEMTPGQIPYWNGETLQSAMISFVPRILWPDKPNLTFGNQFGIRYGVIDQSNTSTTINLTWVVELYANFGYGAVVVGMSLIGSAFALLERWIATPGTAMIDCILPLACIFPLIYPESNIVMMWGGVITSSVLFYGLAYTLKR